ncbi:hydroxyacylglutathione hydrolase [Orbus mooreae]
MMNNVLHIIPALADNYIWLIENQHQQVVIIDPGTAAPVIEYLSHKQLTPAGILLTHHHNDHIGGVLELQKQFPDLLVFGPSEIDLPITNISSQSTVTISDMTFQIIPTPGHTLGHVSYYMQPYLFCGDTLFSAGCGRIFEGTYRQMFNSLVQLSLLPNDTIICPAHEYTLSNLKFAHHLVPHDQDIINYYQQIENQVITLPTTLAREKKINLFLRCDNLELQQQFDCDTPLKLFQFFRIQKDSF